ncbi:NAD-dependent succinate-semialdehyde dehydrogenase [Psychroserpens algicola]|uniref:NAD-dependent succinate-semialdehyde dehydrogenase n=1 Tax=Psychroserpens algicola TaxID=1719034 RepID=A0ABT0HCH4_9FLAO|nr:NAD-dependent succinate-semialdehyde dehydrogenase [Psychroserpens algicola]MCK8482058.1 NAD-dependent succinate-semialdehyde dehydrogenase [Psychroserpens algicola]
MSDITTQNPYTNKVIDTYQKFSDAKVKNVLKTAKQTFNTWKLESIDARAKLLDKVANTLHQNIEKYSLLITNEMGKPISESRAEIEKCMFLCDFYRENAEDLLADEIIKTEATESFISYDPLGTKLAVMPWNYPFWQVMRFAIPTLTAGNTALLKHASNVSGCALIIEDIFIKSGYPKGCFQTLLVDHNQIESIIEDESIKAVSLTGSEKAGKNIAEIAGKHLKKTVLELGGNNSCIVLNDANLDKYLDVMVKARMQNTGQSCIAAKRFIVVESIYEEFVERFTTHVKELKSGDPLDNDTTIGVLAREDLADILEEQIEQSVTSGAKVFFGNFRNKAYYQPTVLVNVKPGMPAFDEETFGPVAAIIKAKNNDEAYEMASNSRFGLGTMVFTEDIDSAIKNISKIEDGAYFINEMVKSDPRLPFGGTKASGYGRELSREGIMEFVNKKTVYINK